MPIVEFNRQKKLITALGLFVLALLVFSVSGNRIWAKSPHADDRQSISAICDQAASRAAAESGVPIDVLRAITRTETGRGGKTGLEPWPWTVNMEGAGKWFETEAEAKAYVENHFQRGARSFDVGCFQINYRWHHQAFESLNDMFDPYTNARYAAKFLQDLHTEFGSWTKAAGAFHSRTPKYADRYVARFSKIRTNLAPMTVVASLPERRVTTFSAPRPLVAGRRATALISAPSGATSAALGSLVPLSGGTGQALIAIR